MKYYGKPTSVKYIKQLCDTDKLGSTFAGISNAAEALGFRAMAIKINYETLHKEAPLPLIVHWNQNHFVVVYKIKKDKVYVSDPGLGLISYSSKEFIDFWIGKRFNHQIEEGLALIFDPTPALYSKSDSNGEKINKLDIYSYLSHYIKPHTKLFVQVLLGLLCGSLLSLLFPFLTQSIIDIGINNNDINFIWLILLGQLMLTLGQMFLEIIRSWTLLHISRRISINLISDFMAKLMKLPIRYFDTKLSGDLMQRIGDQRRIQSFLTNTTLSTVFSLFNVFLYSGVLIYYSLTLFLTFIGFSAAYLIWISIFLNQRKKLDYKVFAQSAETNSKIFELVNGMQELKLHNSEQQKRWQWERIQVKLYKLSIEALAIDQKQGIGSKLINEVKNICLTIISASLVIHGQLTLGMMLAVTYIIGQINSPMLQLIGLIRGWQDTKISINRFAEVYEREDEVSYSEFNNKTLVVNDNFPVPTNHTIKLENISFKYSETSPDVLQGISTIIDEGKVTAIVGESGSGKTTLLKVLLRYYKPTDGKIIVGGKVNLFEINLNQWRNISGVVMQEGYIFNDTIAGNIAVGEDLPDFNRLVNASKLANIFDFVDDLPRKFNTIIGAEGLGISTGQKQRILIARAIYKEPDILFFDEATSSLDTQNEEQIVDNLKSFYKDKTVLIIAHRLSTVKDADKIIVLRKGRIVEEGNHIDLVAAKGYYYDLVKNQLDLNTH